MKLLILGLVIIAQLFVPAFMVYKYESTLKHGELYNINVRPYDPYDPFRGRYVRLDFEREFAQYNGETDIAYGDFVYVSLGKDSEGKAIFDEIFTEKPNSGKYLKVKFLSNYGVHDKPDNVYQFAFIFDRYYSQESKALKIENAVADNRGRRGINDSEIETVSAAVRIKDGLGVIEELYVGDLTIHQYLANKENEQETGLQESEEQTK